MALLVYKIAKARKRHKCTEQSYHVINPGDYYLYGHAPPWHDASNGKKWNVLKACLRCAKEFGLHNSETRTFLEGLK